ncbi:MAG: DUF5916 domain-containing protein [Vicinamibacterales bacterium]
MHKDANTVPRGRAWLGAACIGAALLTLGLSLSAVPAEAQAAPERAARAAEATGLSVAAAYLPRGLQVDGRLDESVYTEIAPTSGFIQQEPHPGEPATETTDVWVFFDDKNLYVSARMWDSHPERILASEMRRDNSGIPLRDESFSVVIDTFHDRRSGFLFVTNPLAALMDGSLTSEKEYNSSFDPIWNPRAGRFDKGWTLEIEIPFKSIRYPGAGPQDWRINFRRVVRWKNEVSHLTAISASYGMFGINRMTQTAALVGLRTPLAGKNLDVKPFAVSRVTTDRLATPPKSGQLDGDVGLDAKYGITPSVTADFTLNTDFAQVEDDQQQVNLTRFSLFFPEKRDFFLEGQGIFGFGGGADTTELPVLFFSRRIGLEKGQAIPLRAGGRVTGKVGPYTLGVLNIHTAASDAVAAPPTDFRVVRLKRDVSRRGSIGVLATDRAPSGGKDQFSYGVDANLGFGVTTINGYYARTQTAGSSGKSASYYGQVDYNADRYGATAEYLTVEPQFSPEIGFLRRADFRKQYGYARYSPRPHAAGVRKLYFEGSLKHITDFAGQLQSRAAVGTFRGDLHNGDGFNASHERAYEFIPRPFTPARGVTIPVGAYSFETTSIAYTLGPVRLVRGTFSATSGTFYDGTRRSAGYTGRIDLTRRLALEPTVTENWIDTPWGRFRTDLVSTRATYSFSPRAGLATLVQYNSSTGSLSSNIRFRWEYTPGSDLFVVYNDASTTLVPDRFAELQSRALLVKMTRLFRY